MKKPQDFQNLKALHSGELVLQVGDNVYLQGGERVQISKQVGRQIHYFVIDDMAQISDNLQVCDISQISYLAMIARNGVKVSCNTIFIGDNIELVLALYLPVSFFMDIAQKVGLGFFSDCYMVDAYDNAFYAKLTNKKDEYLETIKESYQELLDDGMVEYDARLILPLSLMSLWYAHISLDKIPELLERLDDVANDTAYFEPINILLSSFVVDDDNDDF